VAGAALTAPQLGTFPGGDRGDDERRDRVEEARAGAADEDAGNRHRPLEGA
jgi:hypothetical protein